MKDTLSPPRIAICLTRTLAHITGCFIAHHHFSLVTNKLMTTSTVETDWDYFQGHALKVFNLSIWFNNEVMLFSLEFLVHEPYQ